MYTVASPDPDPNPRGGGQLPNPTECNSTLTSATRGETLTPNPNECNSTLTSVSGGFLLPLYYNRWNSSPVQKSIWYDRHQTVYIRHFVSTSSILMRMRIF